VTKVGVHIGISTKNQLTPIVTIYNYLVYLLYIVTIEFLLRSKYAVVLIYYVSYLLKDIEQVIILSLVNLLLLINKSIVQIKTTENPDFSPFFNPSILLFQYSQNSLFSLNQIESKEFRDRNEKYVTSPHIIRTNFNIKKRDIDENQ